MELNELLKLATLLDENGEHRAASKVDALILKIAEEEGITLPPDLLKTLQDSVQSLNDDLEDTIEHMRTQNCTEEPVTENGVTDIADFAAIADAVWKQAGLEMSIITAQDVPPAKPESFPMQEVPKAKIELFREPKKVEKIEPEKFDLPMMADDQGRIFEELEQEFDNLYYRARESLSPEKFKEFISSMAQKAAGKGHIFDDLAQRNKENVMGPGVAQDMSDIENELAMMEKGSAMANVFEKLAVIADSLDSTGAKEEANIIDAFIRKHADPVLEDTADWKEEADTERSKRYDSKHHHDLQVREPKTENERVDYEGRKEHHVSTYKTSGGAGLSSRYCPDHIGVQMGRVGESIYQCPLDGKTYNWDTGYTDYEGNQVPGGSVAAQTPDSSGYGINHRIFDTREVSINEVN